MMEDRPRPITFNCVPLALCKEDALNFTGLSAQIFRTLERDGKIRGRPFGKNGRIIYLTAQIERAMAEIFEDNGGAIEFL